MKEPNHLYGRFGKYAKWAIVCGAMAALLGLVGGGAYYAQPVHHSTKFHVSVASPKPKASPIGRLTLLKAKGRPKMNAENGNVLMQRNPDRMRKAASVAKLMTLYLVLNKLNGHPGDWKKTVKATSNHQLRRMSYNSKVGGFRFKRHHKYTVSDLFKAALIESSNNSAIALGIWCAGSNARFIRMMNAQAQAWRISAHFVSACGLENDDLMKYHFNVTDNKKAANLLSAKAVSVIAYHLIHKYPQVLKLSKQPSMKVQGQALNNANSLVKGGRMSDNDTDVNGLKTGFTPSAGFCFVSTSRKKGRPPLITVVLHDGNEFTDTRRLLNYVNRNVR